MRGTVTRNKVLPDHATANKDVRFYVGNCVDIMSTLDHDTVQTVFADPPFNIGMRYGLDGEEFLDRMEWENYVAFTRQWISKAVMRLRAGGAMFVHVPDRVVSTAYAELVRAGMVYRNWIVLHQEFGQCTFSRFISSHVHCLYFTKPGAAKVWNVHEVLEPSRRLRTGDKRLADFPFKGMRPFLDVWYVPLLGRVQGNNEERRSKHPNQLPEMYLARLLRATTCPGDLVMDPFIGSGTTPTVAKALGRRFVGCELLRALAKSAWERTMSGPVRDVLGPLFQEGHGPRTGV